MRTAIVILLCIMFSSACSSRSIVKNGEEIKIKNAERIYAKSNSISATAPNNFTNTPFIGYTRFDYDLISFERNIPNMIKEDIRIYVLELEKESQLDWLLQKNENKTFDKEFTNKYLDDWEMTNNLERRVNYKKKYVNFISNLKCIESVESSNIADGIGNKKYHINCPFYDNKGNKKRMYINASMFFTFDKTKFEGADNPSLVKYKLLDIEKQFKNDIKEIFDSIKIHNIDIERMKKDELLYDKKYDIEAESKAKDLTFNCKYTNGYILCEGKEINRKCSKKNVKNEKWECK